MFCSSSGDVPQRIRAQCAAHGDPVPDTPGDIVRCIYESLADTYARTLAQIQACTGRHINSISLIGGGARGALLPQLTADRTGCTVVTGPIEATVLGNIAAQLLALGAVSDQAEVQRLLAAQESIQTYYPNRKA